jgi:hypothetical protein
VLTVEAAGLIELGLIEPGGGKGTKAEVASRNNRSILKEWSFYQHNFLDKSKLLSSLKTLVREERAMQNRGDKLFEVPQESTSEFSKFWKELTGNSSPLETVLSKSANLTTPRRSSVVAEDGNGDDSSEDGDDRDDWDEELAAAAAAAAHDGGDGPGEDPGDDEDQEDDADEPQAREEDDEFAEPDDEEEGLETFVPQTVVAEEVEMQVGRFAELRGSSSWKMRLRSSKTRSGHELRLEMSRLENSEEPGGKVLYRITAETIFAFSLTNLQGHDKAKLRICLLAPVNFGWFNTGTKKFNLSQKGASDTGPFVSLSSTVTMLTVTARLTAEAGFSTLLEMWGNASRASLYLVKRSVATCPRHAPSSYCTERAEQAGRDKLKTAPVSIKQERARIRAQAEKIVIRFINHVRYVYSQGKEGKLIGRKCLGCKKKVLIGVAGSHILDDEGQSLHNECFFKVEEWIKAHRAARTPPVAA